MSKQKNSSITWLLFAITLGSAFGIWSSAMVTAQMSNPVGSLDQYTRQIGIGGGIPTPQPALPRYNRKAENLRIELRSLLQEHTSLMVVTMRHTYTLSNEAAQSKTSLGTNTAKITSVIRQIYGNDSAERFSSLWQNHIDALVNYANSRRLGDINSQGRAKEVINEHTRVLNNFLLELNTSLNKDTLLPLWDEHIRLLTLGVDSYANNDFPMAYSRQDDAFEQAGVMADVISDAVVKQFPSDYQ